MHRWARKRGKVGMSRRAVYNRGCTEGLLVTWYDQLILRGLCRLRHYSHLWWEQQYPDVRREFVASLRFLRLQLVSNPYRETKTGPPSRSNWTNWSFWGRHRRFQSERSLAHKECPIIIACFPDICKLCWITQSMMKINLLTFEWRLWNSNNKQQQQNFLKKRTVRGGRALEKLRLYCVEVWKQVMLETWVAGNTYWWANPLIG